MNRRDFGLWGIELSRDDFARALAAVGVVQHALHYWPVSSGEIESALTEAFGDLSEPIPWRLFIYPPELNRYVGPTPASALAEAWSRAVESKGWPFPRLEVWPYEPDPLWLLEELSRPAVRAASVYGRVDEPVVSVGWQWPLRVGLLPGQASRDLRKMLTAAAATVSWGARLARIVELGPGDETCDLLLLPHDVPEALAAVLAYPATLRADAVVVMGGVGGPSRAAAAQMAALRATVRTAGVALVGLHAGHWASWFVSLIAELSHDLSLDVALFRAASTHQRTPPALVAARSLVDFRLSSQIRRMGHSLLKGRTAELEVDIPSASAAEIHLGMSGRHRLMEVGERLRSFDPSFARESDMASASVEIEALARKAREEAPPEAPPERFLQGQVYDTSSEGEPKRLKNAWRAGASHAVVVRVGAPDEEWIAPAPDAFFPYEKLPPDESEHRLTVVFTEPSLLEEPQTAQIVLPRRGNSSSCTFWIYVKEGMERVEGRLIVLHRNRVLQTALLRGPVAGEGLEGKGIELAIEAVVRPGLVDLGSRRHFDAALVLNHDSAAVPRVTVLSDDRAEIRATADLEAEVDWLNRQLSSIAHSRRDFEGGLAAPATVDLLRGFARHGSVLYRYLVTDRLRNDRIAHGDRIQILSMEPDANLPLEFVYDRKAPVDGAGLCPNAVEALRSGRCGDTCPRGEEEKNVICPLGFWGMSRILERHAHQPEFYDELRRDFALQSEPLEGRDTLPVLGGDALLAASHRVDASCRDGSKTLSEAIEKATLRAPGYVEKWPDWAAEIAKGTHLLQVLLVHTDRAAPGDPMQKMEIGKDSWLVAANLDKSYIRIDPDKPKPLVFLLGCETGAPEVSFLGFVGQFRAHGAAIVLSTGSTVHSVHAVPVAKRYIEVLARMIREGGTTTFGEVMRSARRELLADGYPMVLCLAAYGDADWRLTS